jgi:hypothetical protein
MQKNRVAIAQLHLSAGLLKEFLALGSYLSKKEMNVTYHLSGDHQGLIPQEKISQCRFWAGLGSCRSQFGIFIRMIFIGEYFRWVRYFSRTKHDCLLIYSVDVLTPFLLVISRVANSACRNVLFLHEPETRKSVVSGSERLKAYLREYLQRISLLLSDDIVLFSPFAKELFEKNYPKFRGQVHQVCLVVPREEMAVLDRTHVIVANRLFGDGRSGFLAGLVRYCSRNASGIRFRLVTSSRPDKALLKLARELPEQFDICFSRDLTDRAISDSIRAAIVQILPHKNITQSGVLAVAFGCGTPVIARELPGFSQFIRHRQNGYLVDELASSGEWIEGINYIISHFDEMSAACVKSYEEHFAPVKFEQYYRWIQPVR